MAVFQNQQANVSHDAFCFPKLNFEPKGTLHNSRMVYRTETYEFMDTWYFLDISAKPYCSITYIIAFNGSRQLCDGSFSSFSPNWGKEVSIGKKAAPNRNKRWLIVIHIAAPVMC